MIIVKKVILYFIFNELICHIKSLYNFANVICFIYDKFYNLKYFEMLDTLITYYIL